MSKPTPSAPRNAGVFLSQMEEGAFLGDLSREIQQANIELARHAESNGKAKGQVTIVINLAHDSAGVVDVKGEIKVKLPKSSRSRTVFWADAEGNLESKNPKQGNLNFKSIPSDSPAKDLGGPATLAAKDVANG